MAKDIKAIVSAITKENDTRNPFEIADNLGIYVHKGDLGNILGCYMMTEVRNRKRKLIMVNSQIKEKSTELYVMSHELGHAILHEQNECYLYDDNTYFLKNKTEKEAHRFAAELLITDEFVKMYPGMSREQLTRIAGYRINLMEYKTL